MNGFVAPPPAPAPADTPDAIPGDGFWPALSISAFREAVRLGTSVSDARIRHALVGGILSAAAELTSWRRDQLAAGNLIVEDVPGTIAGEPRALVLWRRAVYAYAGADLAETQHDISATADGRGRIGEQAAGAPELLRTATHAIRDLLGTTRTTVKLL